MDIALYDLQLQSHIITIIVFLENISKQNNTIITQNHYYLIILLHNTIITATLNSV